MSYIVPKDIPKGCEHCPFNGHTKCRIMPIGFDEYPLVERRPDWCPLVEVPTPHGRLIDADALHDAMYHRAFETDGDTMWQSGCWVRYRAIEQIHESQPTIIEAERNEE